MKARLLAYAGFQLRDFILGRTVVLVAIAALAAWWLFRVAGITRAAFDPSAGVGGREQLRQAFEYALGAYAFAGAVLAAQGLVARDRWRGFDRLLFSRPVKPVQYYLQGFIVAGVAIMALAVVAAGAFAVAVQPVSVPGVAAYVALTWLMIGSFAFALSTLTAYHLPLLAALLGGAFALDRYAASYGASDVAGPLLAAGQYLLPPAHVVASLRSPFARGELVATTVLAWPVAFGILSFAVAILVLYRRPFRS